MEESGQNPTPNRAASFPGAPGRGGDPAKDQSSSIASPADLPTDPRSFWGDPVILEQLAAHPEADLPSVLQRLGPLPLPRSGFPLIGFLATVYDHVAASATPPNPPSH